MIAIQNSGLANIGIPPVDISLMANAATFTSDFTAKTATVTGVFIMTSPDTFKHGNVVVTDSEGYSVYGAFTTATGNTGALDIAALVLTAPLSIKIVAVSTKGIIAVGKATFSASATSGSLGSFEVSFTTCNGQ